LQVNVAQLLKEQAVAKRVVELDGAILELDDEAPAHVHGKLTLIRTDQGVWASGQVELSADTMCSRCLAAFGLWLRVKVDEVYLPSVEVNTGAKLRYDTVQEADSLKIDEHHVLDFTEAFRQYRLAAIPIAPLCTQDCKGICPECGIDRNEFNCDCEPQPDPRWAKLRELLN
jgi:uncharacterized protein